MDVVVPANHKLDGYERNVTLELKKNSLGHKLIIAIASVTVPRAMDSRMSEKIREMFEISQTTP